MIEKYGDYSLSVWMVFTEIYSTSQQKLDKLNYICTDHMIVVY